MVVFSDYRNVHTLIKINELLLDKIYSHSSYI